VLRFHPGLPRPLREKLAEEIAEASIRRPRRRAAAKIKSTKIKVDVLLPAVTTGSTGPAGGRCRCRSLLVVLCRFLESERTS